MRLAFKSFLTTVFLLLTIVAFGQDFSNKGKDFWIPYPEHIDGTLSSMGIYITSDSAATGTITVAGTNIPFSITANTVARKFLGPNGAGDAPNTVVHLGGLTDNVGTGKAIHVVSDKPVVVFAHIIRSARSGASLILPVTVWGKEYIVPGMASTGTSNSYGELCVMASLPNTQIEITPSRVTRSGRPAGVPFTVTIPNVGDVYQLQFLNKEDMSGTKVRSIATAQTGCVPIAVFSATTWSAFSCNGASGGDNLYQQLFPTGTFGKQFLTGPLKKVATSATDNNTDIIRVYVTDPTTVVTRTLSGTTSTLTGLVTTGNYYEYTSSVPTLIQADKPVQVVQYVASQNCGSPQTNSDPEMIVLSAVEQTINDITVFSAHQSFVPSGQSQITTHYINVIMKTANAGTFRINGVLPTATFTAIPGTSYSYLKEDVTARAATNPVFQLKADSGFNALAYGFGNVESYGYNAGTNVKDQYQYISIQNQYATVNFPATCRNTPLTFSMTFPYQPTQIQWIFGAALNGMGIADVTIPSPVPTTTIVVNGKTLYVYQLSGTYSISTAGTYQILVKAINSTPDGCSGEQIIPFDLVVYPPPVADFTAPNACFGTPVQFTDISQTNNRPVAANYWAFGDNTTATNANPSHLYAAPNTYTVRHAVTTDVGCISDTISKPVTVHPIPSATISGTVSICQGAAEPQITFTGSNGTPPYTFTYNINGGANQQAVASTANSVTVNVPTNITGVFTYTLTSVSYASTPACSQSSSQTAVVSIFSKPTGATITGSTSVCVNGAAPTITMTGAGGSGNYIFTYNVNGGINQNISSTSGSASITVPTNTAGTFTYNLVSVEDPSNVLCRTNVTGTASVIVNPLPTAVIAGTTTVCQGTASPQVTFTGANGTAPYTFTYTLNGGAPQQVVTTTGNSATISVPTTTPGTFTYLLTNVKDASSTACSQAQTGTAIVTVFSRPTGATITGSTSVCVNGAAPTITMTGAGGSGNYIFTYNVNGGINQTISSTSGSASITVPTNIAGTFTYNLVSVEDPSNVLCRTNVTGTATIIVNPLPTAVISGTTTVCQNAGNPLVTFTGANGTAPYTFTYTVNGGTPQQVVSAANGIATVSATTAVAGTFTYTLISVVDGSTTLCAQNQTGTTIIKVNPLPTASIAGTTAVCQSAAQPTVTFTGASGTAPYTFTYNIDGGTNQTVVTTTGNSITVSVPTATPGTFTYNLISVTDASSTICSQNQSVSAIITVNPLPTASIAGTINVCQNATAPLITFTGATGTAPYTFSYNINGGVAQSVTTTAGNSVTVAAPTGVAGTFVYNLISVTDASSTICTQNQTGSATVLVYPLPTASFAPVTPICETRVVSFTDQSVANAGNITGWSWNFGDPASGVLNTSTAQNPTHIFSTAGTYNVTLVVSTNNGCVSINPSIPVVIHARPRAGFINPEVCLNDTYGQFNDTSSVAAPSTITGWNWNFGDPASGVNNTSILQNPQHSYLAVGSYPITLIVTSNQGCKDTVNQNLFVNGSFPLSNFTINNLSNLCANDSISITDGATVVPGVITKIEIYWDDAGQPAVFDVDQNPTPGKVYKHLYPNFQSPLTRTFNIRYRAFSGGVCSNDKLIPVTINAAPKVQFTTLPPICLDAAPYQITQATEIGGVPGSLLFTGPGVSPTGLFSPLVAGPGTHTIRYYFTSTAGGCIDSATQTIRVWIAPTADFTVSSPVCERQAVIFTSTSTATEGTLTQWRWDFGDGTPVLIQNTAAPVQHTFATYGNFVVKLNVVTSNGCVSVAKTMTVTVKPLARPNFSFPAVSCLPDANIAFTNLSTIPDGTQSAFTYLWNFGDPGSGPVNTSTAINPSHTYVALGPYNVNLQVTSEAGCIHDTTIVLNTLHPQPAGSFTTDKIDVCVGGAIRFTSTSTAADGTISQWVWNMDNGDTRNQPTFNYTYSTVGTYNVSHYIVNSFNCKSSTATTTVSINPYPIADAGPDKLMLEGGQTQLTPLNNNTMPVTFRWRPATYLSDSTVQSPIARPPDDIYYTYVITTDKGCSAQDVLFVKVLKAPIVPNIFSPNGDGVHDTWVLPYLDSYPGCTVEVVNRYGQSVFRSVGYTTPWDGTVNGKPVPVGTYYFVIDPKNGRKRLAGYVDIIR
jgi:gliding motility-associated-like protein